MKNFKLITFATLLSVGLITSCSNSEDPKPVTGKPIIEFTSKDTLQIENGTVIGGKITSEAGLTGVDFYYVKGSSDTLFNTISLNNSKSYTIQETLKNVKAGITGIKVIAHDVNKNKSDKILNVRVKVVETPLSAAEAFKLGYPANNPSKNPTSKYGVEYDTNTSAVTAKFAGGFLMLTKAEYEALTTVEAVVAKYKAGSKVTSFTVDSDAKFAAKYFISIENNTYYLIHMTDLKFHAGDNVASFTMKK